jgi:hypothetical protein
MKSNSSNQEEDKSGIYIFSGDCSIDGMDDS